ncbi:MAG: UPF0182 family protein [Candidatus Brocadiia bacterium]
MQRKSLILAIVGVVLVLGTVLVFRLLSGLLVDYWWFRAVDHGVVFTRILWTKVWMWLLGCAVAFGAVAFCVWFTRRRIPREEATFYRWGRWTFRVPSMRRFVALACWGIAGFSGVVGGGLAVALWHRMLLFLNRVPFGVADPIYENDVGFYVFTLPLLSTLQPMFQVLAWVCLGVTGLLYFSAGAFTVESLEEVPRRAFAHLSRIVGVIFLITAAGYFLDRYELLYGQTGAAFGAGYTDVKARLPGIWVMLVASLAVAGVFFSVTSARHVRRMVVAVAGWFGCAVIFLLMVPSFVQSVRVEPNELELEREFIGYAIEMSRRGYGLDGVEELDYPVREDLELEEILAEEATVSNIRVWDKRPLYETYQQIQAFRPYYEFTNIAVDRYDLEEGYTQTMMSLRELNQDSLGTAAQTWVNRRLQYTHGYGACASSVNRHTEEGLPSLLMRDIPPTAPPGMELTRPQIYYGLRTDSYVFTKTRTDEFDYPKGAENAYTRYEGAGGVGVSGFFRKILFAMHFNDMKVLLSDDLTEGSRVMYNRLVQQRVQRVAPYLRLDRDPYAVVHDGRLLWIQDCYTTSRFYPYSEPTMVGRGAQLNYMRNSVKAVVDAYDGSVTLYVADDEDPLIRAYESIFPGIYRPMEQMPEGLRAHVRYPQDFFAVQANKYRTFHMRDARVFYNQEDVWEVPMEQYRGRERPVESYYVTMRLPDNGEAEFILMMPFTPEGRQNMISWLAARCDGEHYGKLVVFMFPKQKLVYGPSQVEARIDQDPVISRQLSLWGQRGSEVLRGNLLVIPVAGGLLYVEPLFIQAEAAAVPQLRRVITAYGERVAMRENLNAALRALFAREPPTAEPGEATGAPYGPLPTAAADILEEALGHYEAAQQALRDGDWQGYGRRMEQMKAALDRLGAALGVPGQTSEEP